MSEQHEFTRWRDLNDQVSPLDPIQPDSPRYVDGELPVGFVLLTWDGAVLGGPMRFTDPSEASAYLASHPNVKEFLIVPKPNT